MAERNIITSMTDYYKDETRGIYFKFLYVKIDGSFISQSLLVIIVLA